MDEKGFILGTANKAKVIARAGRWPLRTAYDGTGEPITVIEACGAKRHFHFAPTNSTPAHEIPNFPKHLPINMSSEGSNLTFEADEEEIFTSSEASDPIIKDFIEEVLHLAQRKACLSTKYTARDILLASKLVLPSSLKSLKGRTCVTAFSLALKEEKANAPPDVLKQQPGVKKNGGAGMDGRYMKWVKQQFDDPGNAATNGCFQGYCTL